ncbi:hypothetical protein NW062_00030 [Mycoplasmopsis cynos]|nr:hypothetical protein NW062_00030 [Mycoplasmopsis cynos]
MKAYSESKKLPKETIIDIFKLEIQKVINKTFDPDAMIEIIYDDQNKIAKLLNIKGQLFLMKQLIWFLKKVIILKFKNLFMLKFLIYLLKIN